MSDQPQDVPNRWKRIVELASHLAVIVGVLVSVVKLVEFVDNSKRATQSSKLSALREIKTFISEDEDVRRRGQRFMREGLPVILPKAKEKVLAAGSGEAFYLSKEMEDFAAVHYHYEQMGTLVKLGYVEFELLFEIIAFPDAYMDAIEPLRAEVAAHWKGTGKPLPDLGSNIGRYSR